MKKGVSGVAWLSEVLSASPCNEAAEVSIVGKLDVAANGGENTNVGYRGHRKYPSNTSVKSINGKTTRQQLFRDLKMPQQNRLGFFDAFQFSLSK